MFGLADEDPAWRELERTDAGKGTSFQTKSVTVAHGKADQCRFTANGFGVSVNTGGKTSIVPQKSAVVKFTSAAADADGLHTMIPASPTPGYALPPMATITLEAILLPGQWQAYGVTVNQKCFVVSVSFK